MAGAAVGIAAFSPFARGLLGNRSLYFRDLALHFFPLRRLVLEGLLHGELRHWNPFTHEGTPVTPLPIGYPPDLLQILKPDPVGISWTLALHVVLAALGLFWLARSWGLARSASACGALLYALGGFSLSSVNLYVYTQAIGWAPFVVLGVSTAVRNGGRALGWAGIAVGLCLSTSGVEVAGQALLIGSALGVPLAPRRLARLGLVLVTGVMLAAPALLPSLDLVSGSAREAGFDTHVVLAHSMHPLTFVQTFVAGFYGDPSNITGHWWGQNFFPRGFPYVLSVYLGGSGLCLAALGACSRRREARVLALLGALASFACLGKYAGLATLVDLLPPLHKFRYPTKLFFTVHFAVAMLAALGLDRMLRDGAAGARRVAGAALLPGLLLASAPAWPRLSPRAASYFLLGFCPPEYSGPLREAVGRSILADVTQAGLVMLGLAAIAFLTSRGQLGTTLAGGSICGLLAADLLRAGAGLNPSVTGEFFELSPETAAFAGEIKAAGGRLFTCDPVASRSYVAARSARGMNHEALTFATLRETFFPSFNVPFHVPTALSIDLTMLVPETRVLSPEAATCADFPGLVERLREAAVTHVLSLDRLDDPALRPIREWGPARIAPLVLRAYRLSETRPRASIRPPEAAMAKPSLREIGPGHLEVDVEVGSAATLVVREGWARGWRASVDGRSLPIQSDRSGHLAVALGAGRQRVRWDYQPPLAVPWSLGAFGLVAAIGLAAGPRRGKPETMV